MSAASVLLVVAHPDDDVLGCGGTARRLVDAGYRVTAAILCGDVGARTRRPHDEALSEDIEAATAVLGLEEPILGPFPNIAMNAVPHLELVQFVEQAILETSATRLVTTHPGDLNDDHRQVAAATEAAARLSQRRIDAPALESLHYMEVLSSTDWAFRGGPRFEPDSYVEIGEDGLEAKLKALACYRGVMREYPHPRSRESLTGLATVRGSEAGMRYAEAFQTAFAALDVTNL